VRHDDVGVTRAHHVQMFLLFKKSRYVQEDISCPSLDIRKKGPPFFSGSLLKPPHCHAPGPCPAVDIDMGFTFGHQRRLGRATILCGRDGG
jgi:hypothetical protein